MHVKSTTTFQFSYHLYSLPYAYLERAVFHQNSYLPLKDFIPAEDEAVLEECLGPDFDKGNEDVIEFLSSLKCFSIPSSDNIKDIINEIAQKELIQQPKYIVHC